MFKKSIYTLIAVLAVTGIITSTFNLSQASTLLSDDFTGTTINTVKWNETDAGGVGGTSGNIQQNGSLSMTGSASWGNNYLVTDDTYDRSVGGLEMTADVTCASGSSIFGIGYGDPGVLTGGGQSYTLYVVSNTVYFSRQLANGNAENITTAFSCTNGVAFSARIAIDSTSGAALYINGSGTAAATLTGGTFTNKGFFLSGHSGTATLIDNVVIASASAATAPDAPTGLTTTPASTAMGLTWTAPVSNGGAAITDYLVEYKLASEPTTWTTFSDGTSTTAATTVTGLTNGLSYNFRVSATNSVGTGVPSSTATATPALSVPSAPQGLSASSGTSGQSTLTWSAPLTNGGAAITDYIVEYKLSTEPTTWTTFSDGTSGSTGATVTGLVNGSTYNFRVSATNSVGTGPVSSTANGIPNTFAMSDDFTGTTIDTDKWTELDPGGTGGTVGNVQQNGDLNITGTGAWGGAGLSTVQTYDRTNGDVSITVTVTRSSCGSGVGPVAIGYGDLVFTGVGTSSYILLANATNWELYYWTGGSNVAGSGPSASPQTLSGFTSCTNGVPFTLTLTALQGGGASVFVNGSGTPSATITSGTFTDEGFWLGAMSSTGTSDLDNVQIIEPATGPAAPSGLGATPGDGQVALTWTAGADNGAAITDYLVEYKLSTSGTWLTFSDGTSTSTGATVTGLTNGLNYNFRVSGINSNGTSDPSSTATARPVSATPTAPTATGVAISGNAAVGEQLTGTYTFVDVNGNSESGSTFRWLTATSAGGSYSAISGATSTTYIVDEDDIGMYLKFEVTPGSATAPTTGSATLSSATSQVATINYLNQILSTGQSLSVGVAASPALSTTQPYSNKMLTGGSGGMGAGGSFTALIESSVETMSSAIANSLTFNDTGNDLDTVMSLHGVSGYTYSQLKKGTGPYTNAMNQVTNAKSAALSLGRVSRVMGVTNIHGETDNFNNVSGATYQGYLEEWQNDYDTDVKAITGQSNEVYMFIDQMSSFMSSYANDATSEIPIYQLYAAEDNPDEIVLVAPKYFFSYSDRHHLTAASSRWLGEYHAKVIKKVAIDHETWRPLSPDTVTRTGNVILADFHVPAGQLAFDTTLVSARTNYGFEYYDSTSSATISSVELVDTDTVRVTLSGTPTGNNQRLRYAYTGVPGTNTGAQNAGSAAGNLRDTDPYPSLYSNTLYNWAVHFDHPVTLDSSAPTITNVSSDKANGTYSVGEVIDIDVTFSKAVTSTGNVTVTLETGATDRTCTFTVTSATSGSCNYTVQAGDSTDDLTVKTISGTIADLDAHAMVNFVPTTNLAANKALVIDTTGPVISAISVNPATTSAVITWTTGSLASTGVTYGLTSTHTETSAVTDTSPRVLSHSKTISSLAACTTYHYSVVSVDASSVSTSSSSATFTTDGCTGSAEVESEIGDNVSNATGGTVELTDGDSGIELDIPAGAVGAESVFQIKQINTADALIASGMPTGLNPVNGHTYDLKALTGIGTSVTSFNDPITLTFSYEDDEIDGISESSLVVWRYSSGTWSSLAPCTVDTNANTVTCETGGFSMFALFGTASASGSTSGSVTRHPVGTNIVDSTGTIYTLTSDGKRRPYTSAGAYLSYGFNTWSNAVPARSSDLTLPVGSFIPPRDGSITCSDRGTDKGTCYLITGGMKAGFVSEKVFKAQGFSFANALYGDVSFMTSTDNISDPNSTHRSGTLINNSGTLQVIKDNALAGIPSMEVLSSWGYNPITAVAANTADKLLQQTQVLVTRAAGVLGF